MTVRNIFELDNFPNDNLLITFAHPCDDSLKVFIGEMPHLVKKLVNRLEKSCTAKNKVKLRFQG